MGNSVPDPLDPHPRECPFAHRLGKKADGIVAAAATRRPAERAGERPSGALGADRKQPTVEPRPIPRPDTASQVDPAAPPQIGRAQVSQSVTPAPLVCSLIIVKYKITLTIYR